MEQLENKAPPHEEQILNMEKTQTTADIDDGGILDCHAQDVGVESSKTVLRALCKFNSRRSNDSLQENTFAAPRESCLDPKSLDFRPSERARAIARLIQGHGISLRSAGICFHNLNVYGFGVESSYQKDVANVWFSLFSKLRTFTGHGRQRVNILRQFDGLVRKGEMLVVLGPPGSGCSTLLKTIAGETNGVHVSRSSYFNYQGKSHLSIVSFGGPQTKQSNPLLIIRHGELLLFVLETRATSNGHEASSPAIARLTHLDRNHSQRDAFSSSW